MDATLELKPTTVTSGGEGLGRGPGGKVVFVPGALPGETVRVETVEERRDYTRARLLEVLEPSPDRVEPPCPMVAAGCGGCQWQHIRAPAQRRLKEAMVNDALVRIGRLPGPALGPTVELDPWAYRTTLRAAVSEGRAALHKAHSRQPVPIAGCLIVAPDMADLLEGPRWGAASAVLLRSSGRTGERFARTEPAGAGSGGDGVRNDVVHEVVAGRTWRISGRSFFQSRPDGADTLAELVGAAADGVAGRGGATAVDLYSGVGVLAGVLADRGWRVTAVESSAAAVADARANLAGTGVRVVRSEVGRWAPRPADLVVADPSRPGLGKPGVAAVSATGCDRLVLVSCDVASLGRDAGLLAAEGFEATSVTPLDMFPQTFHVEVVSVFDR